MGMKLVYKGINFYDVYNVIAVTFDNIDEEDIGQNISIVSEQTSGSPVRTEQGIEYDDVLKLEFALIHKDFKPFTLEEQRKIASIFTGRKESDWLYFSDDDNDIYYNCRCTEFSKKYGQGIIGFVLKFECDSSYAYSGEKTITKSSTSTASNIILNIETDDIDNYLYPEIKIIPTADSSISIINKSDGDNKFSITNAYKNEVITIDKNFIIKTGSSVNIMERIDSFGFPRFIYGNNTIQLIGNFTVEFKYRLPRKVGFVR